MRCIHRSVHPRLTPVILSLMLAVLVSPLAHAQQQTHPWRIGVGGAWATGYMGILALYGIPHERILDSEITTAQGLSAFNIVLLSYTSESMGPAVEEYVKNGGIALIELPNVPSETILPGKRIPAQKGPNIRYEPGSPVTAGLTGMTLPSNQHICASVIPSDPQAVVLARFTDEGANPNVLGKFVDGAKGSPAIVMVPYGKGKLIWAGFTMSTWAALYGRQFVEPFVIGLIKEVSEGQVAPRFTTQMETVDSLISEPRPANPSLVRFRPKTPSSKPPQDGVLEDNPESVDEYDLYGKLAPGKDGTVYLSYYNAKWFRGVQFTKDTVSIISASDGPPTTIRSVKLPPATAARDILIKRRWGYVTVYADGVPLLSAADGAPLLGVVAADGLTDAGCQPIDRIFLADDFMRAASDANPWQTVTGTWQMVQTEGQPTMGANPFRYQGISDTAGITTTGQWFWDDYEVEMSVFSDAEGMGVVTHYLSPDSYLLARLSSPADGKGKLTLLAMTKAGLKELASAPVACERLRWYKLGVRATDGIIEGVLDGHPVVSAPDVALGNGSVGMYVEKGRAQFDDVKVQTRRGAPHPAAGVGPWDWQRDGGTWQAASDGSALTASSCDGNRALSTYAGYDDYGYSADLKVSKSSEVGLFARYQGRKEFVLASLARDRAGKLFALLRQVRGSREQTLGTIAVAGSPDDFHRLSLVAVGHSFTLSVDGKAGLSGYAAAADSGAIGLQVRGSGAFRNWSVLPQDSGSQVSDSPTPPYAGIIDKNTWAGRAGVWRADPAALDTFWHTGYFPGGVDFRVGVYKNSQPVTTARVAISEGHTQGLGYLLTAKHSWAEQAVHLELTKDNKSVASGTVNLADAKADKYCLTLRREGSLFVAGVNDIDGLSFYDAKPSPARYLGLNMAGVGLIHPNDIRVASPDLCTYTFDAAPTDWFIHSGTWQIASRWSCTPGWTWFSAWDTGEALIRTKAKYSGDTNLQFYVGAKMMTVPGGYTEALRDIVCGMCGSEDPKKGYRFVIQSSSTGGTYLMKDNVIVARADGYALSQVAIHNDWTHFTAQKQGNTLSLYWWGRKVMEYVDPAPLTGGYVWLGTISNGLVFPRVSIFGHPEG